MDDQSRIPPPNYTQIPNAIFELMADKDAGVTEAELRVILAIARKTFGWHKKRDKLSLTQLEALTALSRPSVKAGIDAAMARGFVRRTPDSNDKRGGFYYELLVEEPNEPTSKKSELVKNVNQLSELTRTSKEFEPELVKNLNTQKKEKETIKENGGETHDDLARALAEACKINPKIATRKQRDALNEAYCSLKAIGATPEDIKVRADWWPNDWRFKKEGRPPRPSELLEIWETATVPIKQAPSVRKPADLPLVTAQPKRGLTLEERQKILNEDRT